MGLLGWSLPLSPRGDAALVPPPPWHFSGDIIGVDFRTEPEAAAAVLPSPLQPVGDGSATFVFADWSSAADADPRIAADPGRGQYREAYVEVHALLEGSKVARVPYIWVDSDLSLARGLIQGFPKKMGTIAMSRPVVVGRGGPKLEPGATLAAHVSSVGRRLATAAITLGAGPVDRIPRAMRLPIWHSRYMPDLAGGPPLVNDFARNLLDGFEIADAWEGAAELSFGDSPFEELDALAPVEVLGGFRCTIAMTIVGAEVRQEATP
ncbi:MAG: acetoacetate decarboxylase family protein [Acidimicrobiales bacterium]